MIYRTTATVFALMLAATFTLSAAIAPAAKADLRSTRLGDIPGFAEADYAPVKDLTIDEFLELSPKEFRKMTGERMKFKDRIVFGMVKKNMRKQLKKAEKNEEYAFTPPQETAFSFHWGAFFLGLFLTLLGLIISFFFRDGNAWKSALIGMLISIAIWTIIVLV